MEVQPIGACEIRWVIRLHGRVADRNGDALDFDWIPISSRKIQMTVWRRSRRIVFHRIGRQDRAAVPS